MQDNCSLKGQWHENFHLFIFWSSNSFVNFFFFRKDIHTIKYVSIVVALQGLSVNIFVDYADTVHVSIDVDYADMVMKKSLTMRTKQ